MSRVHSIVAAGGDGIRFGGETPKQLVEVAGRSILDWSISRLLEQSEEVVVAVPERLVSACPSSFHGDTRVRWVAGGRSRWRSVRRALEASSARTDDLVAVHDGARPAISAIDLAAVLAAARTAGAAILGRSVSDTIKRVDHGRIIATVDRRDLFRAETPQVFRRGHLERGLELASAGDGEPTDEAALVEQLGGVEIVAVSACFPNPKVTEIGDLDLVRSLLERSS